MLKHNKKKNSLIVYEQLMTLATRLAYEKKINETKDVIRFIKKYFKKTTNIGKEKALLESLLKTRGLSKDSAEKFLNETIRQSNNINLKELEKEKLKLINEANLKFSKDIFDIKVNNYKLLASAQILLQENRQNSFKTSPAERLKISSVLVESLCRKDEKKEDVKVDNFTFKVLIEKFNKKYSKVLSDGQKCLLKEWSNYLVSGDRENFNKFISTELQNLKKSFKTHLMFEVHQTKDYFSMLQEAEQKLNSFSAQTIDENNILEVMKYYDVVEDLENIVRE